MKKHELVTALAEASGNSKAACARVLSALGAVVHPALIQGKSVVLPGVGTLRVKQLTARTLKTPQGQELNVPARAAAKFSPAKVLRDALSTDEAPV